MVAVFYCMAVASVASALLAVTRRSPVHSMLWVLALFLNVAGIFLLLGAEFLAAVQVIVYAGAILIFYLFVQMLLDLPEEQSRPRFGRHWPLAAAAGIAFASLGWVCRGVGGAARGAFRGSAREMGEALLGPFLLPFEIVSLLLLAAIVGAIVLILRKAPAP